MSDTKVVIALFAGIAAGAVLGILFAPQTGTESRDKLTDSLTNLGESIKESASEQIDSLINLFKDKVIDTLKSGINTMPPEAAADDLEHA